MNAEELNKLFREEGRTLTSAESFTGGLFASTMTKVSGASHFYKGGVVTYATEEKVRLLGISYEEVDQYGVISQEIAGKMASGARSLLVSDYAIGFTGNAGPSAMENKPVGEVHIGVAVYDHLHVFKFNLSGSREEIQQSAVDIGIEILGEMIKQYH